mgnify:CR=1 FL=1
MSPAATPASTTCCCAAPGRGLDAAAPRQPRQRGGTALAEADVVLDARQFAVDPGVQGLRQPPVEFAAILQPGLGPAALVRGEQLTDELLVELNQTLVERLDESGTKLIFAGLKKQVIDVMRERWAAIPDFQRTRGALRFLAACLRAARSAPS